MKLKKFLADLNKLAKEHPEYLKYEVIYSIDDEGNSFLPVVWEASVGYYDGACETFETESDEYILSDYENARELKKRQLKHLVESGLIEGTVIILDNENRIVN